MKETDKKELPEIYRNLCETAEKMRQNSYAPYSHWTVGAALLAENGEIYAGCNVENAAYTPTCCGERNAFFQAISKGERKFSAIAVCGGNQGKPAASFCSPCGVCRQVVAEFCEKDFCVLLTDGKNVRLYTLEELLPVSFGEELSGRTSYENV